jgi:hypothetical protein
MREVDDAAEREDQREAERDQKVIRTDQQPVQDLLDEENELHVGGLVMDIRASFRS